MWQPEDIPDGANLYMRVHRCFVDEKGRPTKGAFRNNEPPEGKASGTDSRPGMSTDWDRYSTAQQTRNRGPQAARNYAVVALRAGQVRQVPGQTVAHTPQNPDLRDLDPRMRAGNRAHTDVYGDKKSNPEVRTKLRDIAIISIRLDEPGIED